MGLETGTIGSDVPRLLTDLTDVREVTSRLILRNGVEWGLKGGEFVKNASNSYIDISVQKHFLRTFPGGQFQGALSSVEASQ